MELKRRLLILTCGLWLLGPMKIGVKGNGLGSAPRRQADSSIRDPVDNETPLVPDEGQQTTSEVPPSISGKKARIPTIVSSSPKQNQTNQVTRKETSRTPKEEEQKTGDGDASEEALSVVKEGLQVVTKVPTENRPKPTAPKKNRIKEGVMVITDENTVTVDWHRNTTAKWLDYVMEARTALAIASGALMVSILAAVLTWVAVNKRGKLKVEVDPVEAAPPIDWMALLGTEETKAKLDQICQEILQNTEFRQDVAGIRKNLNQQVTANTDGLLKIEMDLKFAKRQITDLEKTFVAWQEMTLDLAEKVTVDQKKTSREAPKGKRVYLSKPYLKLRSTLNITQYKKIIATETLGTEENKGMAFAATTEKIDQKGERVASGRFADDKYESVDLFAGRKTPNQMDTDDKVGFSYEADNPFLTEAEYQDTENTLMGFLTGTKRKTIKRAPKRRAPSPPPLKPQAYAGKDKRSASVIEMITRKRT